jgi:hypothetical protein
MPASLDKLSLEFRSAVLAGDHALAGRLVSEYGAALEQFWGSLSDADRAASPIPQQAAELLSWAQGMTVVQRAMAGAQLAVVESAKRYNVARSVEAPSLAVHVSG